MNVTISARHCSIPDTLRSATETRMRRLARYHARIAQIEVIFDGAHDSHSIEARAFIDGSPTAVAKTESTSFRFGLDEVADRLARQLKRRRERKRRHRAGGSVPQPAP